MGFAGVCRRTSRGSLPLPVWFSECFSYHRLAPTVSLFLSTSLNSSFLLPSFRIQYSLNVADRLADEHVLIGLYVNMLRNNPSWLVQNG